MLMDLKVKNTHIFMKFDFLRLNVLILKLV